MDAVADRDTSEVIAAPLGPLTMALGAEVLDDIRQSVIALAATAGGSQRSDMERFASYCLNEAARRSAAKGGRKAASLHDEALRVATEACGLDRVKAGRGAANAHVAWPAHDEAPAAVRRVAASFDSLAPMPVPASRPQHMPAQPLGELPGVLDRLWWKSTVRLAWRQVWGVLAQCYACLTASRK
ncbi:MAG TPA: hypothetical protein VEQ85_03030 [Lacipirellulaceae bacterium]|nr:hypothetical protein [Lacipirellulaceae bacterium]